MIDLPPQAGTEELIAMMRPPYPDGFFPLGAGWTAVFWAVAGIVSAAVLIYNSPRMRRRREAFDCLKSARRAFFDTGDVSGLAAQVSVLLRRAALHRFGRTRTAGLSGRDWTDFLRDTGARLNEEDVFLLENQAFAPADFENDLRRGRHFLVSARKWLEKNL